MKTAPKRSIFTLPGYNDAPQPCLEKRCEGLVEPTFNANVGQCNSCETTYNWGHYWDERGTKEGKKYD